MKTVVGRAFDFESRHGKSDNFGHELASDSMPMRIFQV
jgi:hypothetical protein